MGLADADAGKNAGEKQGTKAFTEKCRQRVKNGMGEERGGLWQLEENRRKKKAPENEGN